MNNDPSGVPTADNSRKPRESVTLSNGSTEILAAVKTTWKILERLQELDDSSSLAITLDRFLRGTHKFHGPLAENLERMTQMGLISYDDKGNPSMHKTVRNVCESALKKEGYELVLVDPLIKQEEKLEETPLPNFVCLRGFTDPTAVPKALFDEVRGKIEEIHRHYGMHQSIWPEIRYLAVRNDEEMNLRIKDSTFCKACLRLGLLEQDDDGVISIDPDIRKVVRACIDFLGDRVDLIPVEECYDSNS